ncbi:MAG: helicase-exonuclease AddAB subunit AddA [Bacillota bacterium]
MGKTLQWTTSQIEAIETKDCNILVAAAAGSGKTAVLVERIVEGVLRKEDPLDLERLLVVTFTEAAAREMSSRIGAALEKALALNPSNEYLQKQLLLINRASISTIHSFCLGIVRQYFFQLELDPIVEVMGENESGLLKQEILENILEKHYEEGSEEFFQLVSGFGWGREEKLGDLILRLENFLATQVAPENWLQTALKAYQIKNETTIEDLPWFPIALQIIGDELKSGLWKLAEASDICQQPGAPHAYLENLRKEKAAFEELLAFIKEKPTWQTLRSQLVDWKPFSKLPGVKKEDVEEVLKTEVTRLRDGAKGDLNSVQEYLVRSPQELLLELQTLAPLLQELADLVLQLQKEYGSAKRQKGRVDFNDLERYALDILGHRDPRTGELRPSAVAVSLTDKYQSVMIDEYQDINDLQEAILKLVSGGEPDRPNLFMVGDVKQSIYGFRQANPGLFLDKYKTYSKVRGAVNRKILLSANFRSRRGIIDGTNYVFSRIMNGEIGEIDYDEDERLIFSAHYPQPTTGIPICEGPVELHLLNRDSQIVDEENEAELEDIGTLEKEAYLIADRIHNLVTPQDEKSRVQVWDSSIQQYRPVSYRDIVILLRGTKNKANVFLEVFQQLGIPAYAEVGTGYFRAVEVGIMLSLLTIIDNPMQDIHLVGVLRSPLVGLTSGELAKIRAHTVKDSFWSGVTDFVREKPDQALALKLESFLRKLKNWRTEARRGPLSHLIWQIYQETGFLSYAGAMPGGKQRKANLHALYERAMEFDSFARHGLFRFLRYIEKLQAQDEDLGLAGAYGENTDVVRIMSIHKSKGLEFPIVFVANLGGKFNQQDLRQELLFHPELGIGSLYFDLELKIKYPTLPHWVLKSVLRHANLAEELRILYVAFTRAREKLILVGSIKKLEDKLVNWDKIQLAAAEALPAPLLKNADSFLDWVGPAVMAQKSNSPLAAYPFRVYSWDLEKEGSLIQTMGSKKTLYQGFTEKELQQLCSQDVVDSDLQQELSAQLAWVYPYQAATEKPAKITATELKRQVDFPDDGQRLVFQTKIASRPQFIQKTKGLTGAELGTAMHLVMQFLDFKKVNTREEISLQIEEMVCREFLTEEQALAVGWKSFLGFFQTTVGQKLIAAAPNMIKREMPFTLAMPAGELFHQLEGRYREEELIVQGIIDCLLIEPGGVILIDYKNDYLRSGGLKELAQNYRPQLELYAKATETIFQLPVKEKYLYFFRQEEGTGVVAL